METKDYLDFTYYEMSIEDRRKLDVGDIYDNKIQCNLCGWIIRSKNRHHMVKCKCGKVSVDGGSWYQKIGGKQGSYTSHTVYFKHIEETPTPESPCCSAGIVDGRCGDCKELVD